MEGEAVGRHEATDERERGSHGEQDTHGLASRRGWYAHAAGAASPLAYLTRTLRLSAGLARRWASCRSRATRSTYMRVTVRLEWPNSFWRAKASPPLRRNASAAAWRMVWGERRLVPGAGGEPACPLWD